MNAIIPKFHTCTEKYCPLRENGERVFTHIENDQYEDAKKILNELEITLNFFGHICLAPLLIKDFENQPKAKQFFVKLLEVYPAAITPKLFLRVVNNLHAFEYLLDKHGQILKESKVIEQCFNRIISNNYTQQCEALLSDLSQRKISVTIPSLFLQTLKKPKFSFFKLFVKNMSFPAACFPRKNTLLHELAKQTHIIALLHVFKTYPEKARFVIDQENEEEETPLLCAIKTDSKSTVDIFLMNGANLYQMSKGKTLLQIAQETEKSEVVKVLEEAEHGVFLVADDINAESSLQKRIQGQKEKGLLKCIEDIKNTVDIDKNIERIKKIIKEAYVNINFHIDDRKNTLACFAAQFDLLDLYEFLKEKNANFFLANDNEETPTILAAKYKALDVLSFLEMDFPNSFIDKTDTQGKTALVYLIERLRDSKKLIKMAYLRGIGEEKISQSY